MPNSISIHQAIQMGYWDFEPEEVDSDEFSPTGAMPGTSAKLDVLAERLESGLPLWHPHDRQDCEESADKFSTARPTPVESC